MTGAARYSGSPSREITPCCIRSARLQPNDPLIQADDGNF
jgi:hypothetical protein